MRVYLRGAAAAAASRARRRLPTCASKPFFNCTHSTLRIACVTTQKVQSVFFLKTCVRRAACATSDILADIVTHDVFNLFRLKSTFDNHATAAINTASGTELGKHVRLH